MNEQIHNGDLFIYSDYIIGIILTADNKDKSCILYVYRKDSRKFKIESWNVMWLTEIKIISHANNQ